MCSFPGIADTGVCIRSINPLAFAALGLVSESWGTLRFLRPLGGLRVFHLASEPGAGNLRRPQTHYHNYEEVSLAGTFMFMFYVCLSI